jgi:hypothetical protein
LRSIPPSWLRLAAVLAALACFAIPCDVVSDDAPVDYAKQIRPILSNHCYRCHGPDEAERQGGLRLDDKDVAFGLRESGGRAIVPGSPDDSLLIQRIFSEDDDARMPPPDAKLDLSPDQRLLLKTWIEQGAPWRDHWSFQTPRRPALPEIRRVDWPRNAVDRFILARLEREGLEPSPAADNATLVRRLTLDLTGLPPTPEEIDAFLDDHSDEAYERLVDRLLNSPRYGEHMARYWLDAARYGDTHGLHLDNYRSMWPYRDWVIRAWNDNLPFDRFTIEQIAGDLLPDRTPQQQIASGFNRCNVTTSEGGSIDEEFYVRYTVDRVETTATVWMGLTLGCAVCHDHKYDPFTQKDFYQLFAYFNNIAERPMDGNAPDPPPILKVATPEQQARLADLDSRIERAKADLEAPMPEVDAAQEAWEAEWTDRLARLWRPIEPTSLHSTGGATLRALDDASVLAEGENPSKDVYEVAAVVDDVGATAVRLEALTHDSLLNRGPGRSSNSNFVLSEFELTAVSVLDPSQSRPVKFTFAHADFFQENGGYSVDKAIDGVVDDANGWAVAGYERHENSTAIFVAAEPFGFPGGTELRFRLRHETHFAQHAMGRFRLSISTDPALTPSVLGPWYSLGPFLAVDGDQAYKTDFGPENSPFDAAARYGADRKLGWTRRKDVQDGRPNTFKGRNRALYLTRTLVIPSPRRVSFALGSDDALKVWLDGRVVLDHNVQRPLNPDDNTLLFDLEPGEHRLMLKVVNYLGDYAFAFRLTGDDGAAQVLEVAPLLAIPKGRRTEAEAVRLRDYFRANHSEEWRRRKEELAHLQQERQQLESQTTPTLVMQEMDGLRDAFILVRGEYDKRGPKVERALPAVLPPMPKDAPNNRLGLALWLVDPSHPLTARVTVNRFWQQLFGVGLVKTAEDFGAQGEFPSHPELLDWLAVEFVESGWDVKRFLKLLVMSAAYRQSSRTPPDLAAMDPENRLLARGPRFRLDAEVVRDSALAISGLLVEQVGGPSVKPYQPPGVWEAVAYPTSNTANFQRDEGDALYRRSLYTFWKRTAHPPAMATFDAPSREACTVRRSRTNTPLQALVLMNDEQYVEAARALARRVLAWPKAADEQRLARAFRLATGRPPSPSELAILVESLEKQRRRFADDVEAARALAAAGEVHSDPDRTPQELAAWTMIANMLLNLDETITKG